MYDKDEVVIMAKDLGDKDLILSLLIEKYDFNIKRFERSKRILRSMTVIENNFIRIMISTDTQNLRGIRKDVLFITNEYCKKTLPELIKIKINWLLNYSLMHSRYKEKILLMDEFEGVYNRALLRYVKEYLGGI